MRTCVLKGGGGIQSLLRTSRKRFHHLCRGKGARERIAFSGAAYTLEKRGERERLRTSDRTSGHNMAPVARGGGKFSALVLRREGEGKKI